MTSLVFEGCKPGNVSTSSIVFTELKHLKPPDEQKEALNIGAIYTAPVKLVNLKSNNDFIIGKIDKVILHKDKIYVLDKSIAKELYIFDIDGKPLGRINKKANKLKSIRDFSIDEDTLYILDETKKNICVFDINGTTLIKTIKLKPNNISNFEVINKDIICYRTQVNDKVDEFQNSTLFSMNLDGEIKDYWLPINESNLYFTYFLGEFPVLQKDKNYIYISRFMDNNIYKYSYKTKRLINSYSIDFGKNKISDNLKSIKDDNRFVNELNNGEFSYSASGYIETDSILKSCASINNTINSFVVNKKTGKVYNGLKYNGTFLPIVMINQLTNDLLVANIPLEILIDLKAQFPKNKVSDPLYAFLKEFDVKNSNPALIILKK